ncbi:MAG: 4Fe-4S binding protein [Desulfotignum sp.]|nr:4Fe-4S binding protein [Desulfotignum sp.]MCF8087170.1 4Fe-4S binding protein [Desulfotignum sp.]MCF8136983.1 4Fe-4S binding protein [Desulfotignum sp.]
MKVLRKIIEIDDEKCDGCGNCVPSCAEGAIQIVNGKARVISDKYCDGLGACLGECPQDALHIVEREAEEFDEAAVHELLKQQAQTEKSAGQRKPVMTGCCPSAALKTFSDTSCDCANQPRVTGSGGPSALGHWPVQIRLVPAGASFLKDADLVIAADCVPVAYPSFHRDFLAGKAVMIGCPKFDDTQGYVDKLTDVFKKSGIKTITAVIMEVPCCSGLPHIIKKALENSGMDIPFSQVTISARGEILS